MSGNIAKEQLLIHDFGPIADANIALRDLTIFVGPQATGKSIAAQILCFMRGLESLVLHPVERTGLMERWTGPSAEADLSEKDILSALEWWLGNALSVYTTARTVLSWDLGRDLGKKRYGITWGETGPTLSEDLVKRTQEWSPFGRQVYIPAGRTLFSFLPPASALRFLSSSWERLQWPGYVFTFYEALADAIRQLWHDQERGSKAGKSLPLTWHDQGRGKRPSLAESRFDIDTDWVQERIDAIFKGRIRYGPDTVALEIGQNYLRPDTIAAGQMELWPFWTILQVSFKAYADAVRIYFEEPEAHLHPGAQRDVMEIITYLVGQGGQFVLTTHSPFILYAINNALMAQKVLDAGQDLPPDISEQSALRPEHVAAYRFSEHGTVHDIFDAETGLIDEDELDRVADDLGTDFTRLQERLAGMG